MKKIILTALSLSILAACGGKAYPTMISFTPASVVVDYTYNDLHEATSLAQQYCSSLGKDAQYVRSNESGPRHGFFNCVESAHRNHNSSSYNSGGSTVPVINNNFGPK